MFLQGDLQVVFDALYGMGVIEPVLKKNWKVQCQEIHRYQDQIDKAVQIANACQSSSEDLATQLQFFDQQTLEFLAMEVAKEFADFHSRETIH